MLLKTFRERKDELRRYLDSEHGHGTPNEEEALVFN
jgi:hypothetical protein